MKKLSLIHKIMVFTSMLIFITALTGCGQKEAESNSENANSATEVPPSNEENKEKAEEKEEENQPDAAAITELEVRFGDEGTPFTMHLYDNETAEAIAGYVGSSSWRLPIYERDDSADYDVMQYYNIPDRYQIPSSPHPVTSEKAGEVYYSEPNRIILFYHDAEIEGEYTPIGYFDATDHFITAVEENPVLEGWGNKIVQIARPE